MRVLKWIVDRVGGAGDATESAIGWLPTPEAVGFDELGLDGAAGETLLDVDSGAWLEEANERGEYLSGFGDKLPAAIRAENDDLISRLQSDS
jgi:phosphoenolpyruvate carboxykinase (GTP)